MDGRARTEIGQRRGFRYSPLTQPVANQKYGVHYVRSFWMLSQLLVSRSHQNEIYFRLNTDIRSARYKSPFCLYKIVDPTVPFTQISCESHLSTVFGPTFRWDCKVIRILAEVEGVQYNKGLSGK